MKNNNLAHEADSTAERRGKVSVRLARLLSLYATIGASIFGTAAAYENDSTPPYPAAVIAETNHTTLTAGGHDVAPGEDEFMLPGVRFDASKTETLWKQDGGSWVEVHESVHEQADIQRRVEHMMWARLFAEDPDARKTADRGHEVQMAAEDIGEAISDGWTVDKVTLHGFASDEDDTTHVTGMPGAGLGVDSVKNVELAEHRADAVMDMLVEELKNKFTDTEIKAMHVLSSVGTEARDDDLNSELNALAKSNHMTVNDMIVAYNRGNHKGFTSADLKVLDQLKDHRYVSIEMDMSRVKDVTSLNYVEGQWREVTEDERTATVVVIPILIPIIRRRRETSPTPVAARPPVARPQTRQIPPRTLGKVTPQHDRVGYHHKQPTTLNQGTSHKNINRGGRQVRAAR